MDSIEKILTHSVVKAVSESFDSECDESVIQVIKTRKDFEGDLTIVVFPLVRMSRKSPEQTADVLGQWLEANVDDVVGYNVVKGFLNLSISDKYWISFLNSLSDVSHFGFGAPKSRPQVMVEYSSPNTNKPLHLGHLRNNFLGYSVAEILKAVGHDVIKVQIINDRGIHICKSMIAWKKFGNGETPETSGMKGDHLVGKYYVLFDKEYKKQIAELVDGGMSSEEAEANTEILAEARDMLKKWEERDTEVTDLWKTMNGWVYDGFSQTYDTMGVDFDKLYYESNTYLTGRDEVMAGLESGVFFKKEDGSVWCDLTADGLDEKLVLRKDGTSVYMTQDIGTAILRFKDYDSLSYQIYTVGNEQEYHFKVLFMILEKLGFKKAQNNHHLSYGMVELPSGKMKSREGTVVDADDLLREMEQTAKKITDELGKLDGVDESEKEDLYRFLGHGALKYFLLKVDPKKNMLFDPEESVDFNGNTAPYIQFNYVRTQSILRKFDEDLPDHANVEIVLSEVERSLIKKIRDFAQVLEDAAESFNPSILASYCYELVREYSSFYQACPILREENTDLRNLRILVSLEMGKVLKSGMALLGIDMPDRM
jgi:arginyl-tRNA synthetase